ncbi:hypothetical protein CPB84DRAFT_1764885 [Gymnopilus junonius]|uniref:Secreted protein n=1 Tax=Gymnopilus junonius TaxID=109634 RepID=A0A9P5NZ56_GYMJU|nr:hypothetical protein CPB84DRAFT_1764885 [Gymnopilus junonius]
MLKPPVVCVRLCLVVVAPYVRGAGVSTLFLAGTVVRPSVTDSSGAGRARMSSSSCENLVNADRKPNTVAKFFFCTVGMQHDGGCLISAKHRWATNRGYDEEMRLLKK